MFEDVVAISDNRLGVLIGKGGEMRRILEKMGGVKIIIKDGQVKVIGEDPLSVEKAKLVIKAIDMGFNPYDAVELFNENVTMQIFDIAEITPNEAAAKRQIARIIGEHGSAKRFLEKTLGVSIAIKGTKVAVIGEPESIGIARQVIERLAHGASHASAFRLAELRMAKVRREKLREKAKEWNWL